MIVLNECAWALSKLCVFPHIRQCSGSDLSPLHTFIRSQPTLMLLSIHSWTKSVCCNTKSTITQLTSYPTMLQRLFPPTSFSAPLRGRVKRPGVVQWDCIKSGTFTMLSSVCGHVSFVYTFLQLNRAAKVTLRGCLVAVALSHLTCREWAALLPGLVPLEAC